MYVWFEAVIGYLSAAIEWAKLSGDESAWHKWWTNPDAKGYYFIGKDNIPFHAVMWPAQLNGVGEWFTKIHEESEKPLTLPFDVPANEFMNMEDRKISGSTNWGVWGLDFLERYQPDALRFYLTINMPETRDSNWDWDDFVTRNNSQLVANWGNLANRVLSFAHKYWEGVIPAPGTFDEVDQAVLKVVEDGFDGVGKLIESVKIRPAIQEALRIASEVNKYLDDKAPWSAVKTDKEGAATTMFVALECINMLKVIFSPFLPHSSDNLHGFFGYQASLFGEQYTEVVSDSLGKHTALRYKGESEENLWQKNGLVAGSSFEKPTPLFQKLDAKIADEERERISAG